MRANSSIPKTGILSPDNFASGRTFIRQAFGNPSALEFAYDELVKRPIRRQILIPFSLTLLGAVGTIAVSAAWLAAKRSEQQSLKQLNGILETLTSTRLTYTPPILEKIHGLSGVDLIALDRSGRVLAATVSEANSDLIEAASDAPLISAGESFSVFPRVAAGEDRYFAARLKADGAASVNTLLVLYPEQSWQEQRWAAAWPPLVIGGVTLCVVFAISVWLAGRIGSRVGEVQRLLAQVERGEFEEEISVTSSAPIDELDALVQSAGGLLSQLSDLKEKIRHTEQVRLLGQLAGGLAHQLRNAVAGARLAIQLHQRRCDQKEESLSIALRQLLLTEHQIRGLLSLGRKEEQEKRAGCVVDLMNEVEQFVRPHAEHAHVEFEVECCSAGVVDDVEAFRTAVLNLALNAVEAAGAGGTVSVRCEVKNGQVCVEVSDTGPGPAPELEGSLFEPFVTSKQEGVGLGLALVRQAAERSNGTAEWLRRDNETVFRFSVPAAKVGVTVSDATEVEVAGRHS